MVRALKTDAEYLAQTADSEPLTLIKLSVIGQLALKGTVAPSKKGSIEK